MADPNLTETLAQKNPNAYRARFKRLSLPEQRAHADSLSPQAYAGHCTALGEVPSVNVHLTAAGASVDWLRVEFGGLKVTFEKVTWADAARHLSTSLAALPGVGVAGSLMLGADAIAAEQSLGPGLRALGWSLTGIEFTTTNTTDGGRVRAPFATAATIILEGSTGAGPLRGHVCLAEHQLETAEPAWQALSSRLGTPWRRT
ncbi:MAG: hypothetical protein Q8L48_22100 [Archangium sp.]|nr:hypothetical protein [Archangium sp.]